MSTLRSWISAILLVALSGISGAVFARLYSGPLLIQLMVVAAGVAIGLSALLRASRVSLTIAVVTSIVALFGFLLGITALARPAGTGSVGTVFIDALRNSGARILTSTIPIEPVPDTILLPVTLIWVSALVAAELLFRTRLRLAVFTPPTIVYGLALVFVGPNARPAIWWALVYVVTLLAGLAIATETAGSRATKISELNWRGFSFRQIGITTATLVIVLAATAILGPAIAGISQRQPPDPRSQIQAPQQRLSEANPLARLAGWAREANEPLFTVTTNQPSRIHWAVLTDYDGLTWHAGNQYRPSGSVLPILRETVPETTVIQEYTLDHLKGIWLPAVAQANQISGARVSYDPATGTLLYPDGTKLGQRYTVRSGKPKYDVAALGEAGQSTDAAIRRYARQPGKVPEELYDLATTITRRAGTPYHQALLLEQWLRQNCTFSTDAPAGHSLPNLEFFLTADASIGGHQGTSEQFATAFALLARLLGLPTRVAVGFHAGTQRSDGSYEISSDDAFAWPEIHLEHYGWIAFDPTPDRGQDIPKPPEEDTEQARETEEAKQEQLEQIQQPTPTDAPQATDQISDDQKTQAGFGAKDHLLKIAISVGVGLVVFGVIFVFIARRYLQSRRLNKGSASERVIGAWREIIDALRLDHRWPGHSATAAEIAAAAALPTPGYETATPLPSITEVAELVNVVAFAPDWVSEADAHHCAQLTRAYLTQLRRSRSWSAQLVWILSPRPLLWAYKTRSSAHEPPRPPSRDVQAASEGAKVSVDSTATTWKQ